jgi:hypothetical protein
LSGTGFLLIFVGKVNRAERERQKRIAAEQAEARRREKERIAAEAKRIAAAKAAQEQHLIDSTTSAYFAHLFPLAAIYLR